jgi:hypothetical protein
MALSCQRTVASRDTGRASATSEQTIDNRNNFKERTMKTAAMLTMVGSLMFCSSLLGQASKGSDSAMVTNVAKASASADKQQQLIIWTSGDREVALKMVFMYALNCKKRSWMDNVRLLIWGPSGKLLIEDSELQKYLNELKEAGVELYACKGCADLYGISDKLSALGVNVMYTGKMLADMQKDGWHVLSF